LTVFLEVEVHVNILLCTLKIFLSVEGWIERNSLNRSHE
jgi:hypothetical protein